MKTYQIYCIVNDPRKGWDLQRVGQTRAQNAEHALRIAKTKGYIAPAIDGGSYV